MIFNGIVEFFLGYKKTMHTMVVVLSWEYMYYQAIFI